MPQLLKSYCSQNVIETVIRSHVTLIRMNARDRWLDFSGIIDLSQQYPGMHWRIICQHYLTAPPQLSFICLKNYTDFSVYLYP